MRYENRYGEYPTHYTKPTRPIAEVLLLQSKGKFITPEEKQEALNYAEEKRKNSKKK